jgi:NTE family protein
MAAQIASVWDPIEMASLDIREFQKLRLDKRVTVPTISLLSVRAAAAMFERMFGDAQLEDLWLPAFVTTVDLSRGSLAIHERGKVATWVRASASPPALWPPVADRDGSLHVDGAVLDNMPVETMRRSGADRVIAVDVSTAGPFRVGPRSPEIATALTPFLQSDKSTRYPNLVKVLNRSAVVTSLRARELARESADLLIVPELAGVGLTEYGSAARIIELGYAAASEELDRAKDDLATWI